MMSIDPLQPGFTDELTCQFYTCPQCDFDHIPYLYEDLDYTPAEMQTRFCPGCGEEI